MLEGPDKYLAKIRQLGRQIRQFYVIANEVDDENLIAARLTPEDVDLLVSLMSMGLLKANLFPLLLRQYPEAALGFMISRYLARHINYDEGANGFTSDLSGFFDEIVSLKGEDALRVVLNSPRVDARRRKDRRVHTAIFNAVDGLDSPESVSGWLKQSAADLKLPKASSPATKPLGRRPNNK